MNTQKWEKANYDHNYIQGIQIFIFPVKYDDQKKNSEHCTGFEIILREGIHENM